MIAVIDYGMGNLRSVEKALQVVGEEKSLEVVVLLLSVVVVIGVYLVAHLHKVRPIVGDPLDLVVADELDGALVEQQLHERGEVALEVADHDDLAAAGEGVLGRP